MHAFYAYLQWCMLNGISTDAGTPKTCHVQGGGPGESSQIKHVRNDKDRAQHHGTSGTLPTDSGAPTYLASQMYSTCGAGITLVLCAETR